ncbi:MAG: hypothetical protein AAFS10_05090 [Myxococcota bacterium]
MTIGQADYPRADAPSKREDDLPSTADLLVGNSEVTSLDDAVSKVKAAFKEQELELEPLQLPGQAKALDRFLSLHRTSVPDPLEPNHQLSLLVAVTYGEWTSKRIDTFIATMAAMRRGPGLPTFLIYGTESTPAEVAFLFETTGAGTLEISAWDVVDDEHDLTSEDCAELAAAGRALLAELYEVDLDPLDLHWLSVVHQVIDEELRWFTDDPMAAMDDAVDYLPFASLLLLGCIAGETIRLNHDHELMWADAEGQNWPRLGHRGSPRPLPVIDAVFMRFEGGATHDLWQGYQTYYTAERLEPPESFAAEGFNPLEFLPNWDPEPDADLADAIAIFRTKCAEANIALEPHPITLTADNILQPSTMAFTCVHDEQRYDLFVATAPWTEERTHAFLRVYGYRCLEDWEIGMSPIFVFFSGHPLSGVLEYSFVSGPPIAPLEGLARVETPSPKIPEGTEVMEILAHWLLEKMEKYTTIGLELNSERVLPGLEFLVREELSESELELDQDLVSDFEPLALLVTVGLTAGESVRKNQPDRVSWVFEEGHDWPVMDLIDLHDGHPRTTRVDWVERTRAIWRGDTDEFGSIT